jgi:hypothetical protein
MWEAPRWELLPGELVAADVTLMGHKRAECIGGPRRVKSGQNDTNRAIRAKYTENNR